jgi:bacterioferritin-associated ferredoxin
MCSAVEDREFREILSSLLARTWEYKRSDLIVSTISKGVAEFRLEKNRGIYRLSISYPPTKMFTPIQTHCGLSQIQVKEIFNQVKEGLR